VAVCPGMGHPGLHSPPGSLMMVSGFSSEKVLVKAFFQPLCFEGVPAQLCQVKNQCSHIDMLPHKRGGWFIFVVAVVVVVIGGGLYFPWCFLFMLTGGLYSTSAGLWYPTVATIATILKQVSETPLAF